MKQRFGKLPPDLNNWKHPAGIIIFLLLAYLPLSSFHFALKNDAFIYNFPNKHFFSESLQHGFLPTWNPYLNYGFPLYADPGFAWWHPITWLFGVVGYNPYTFTIEVLLYICIAGLGMYWLALQLKTKPLTAAVMGCTFAASGFFIGNLQHINFLTCAAFIPWLVGAWLRLQETPNFKNALKTAVATYLLCTAGHPAIPIATLYFMFLLAFLYFYFQRSTIRKKTYLQWNSLYLALSFLLLLLPFLSWFQLMPFYSRSESVNHQFSNHSGFTLASFLSFLSPVATIKGNNFFQTDLSMRNGYFSLLGLSCLIAVAFQNKNKLQKIFLAAGLVLLFLSLGGAAKQFIFSKLPLLSFIRSNGEFRVFAIFCFVLIGGLFLNNFSEQIFYKKRLLQVFKVMGIFSLGASIFTFLYLFKGSGFNVASTNYFQVSDLKNVVANLTFEQVLLLGSFLCFLFSAAYFIVLKRTQNLKFLFALVLFDLLFYAWIMLPVTGVGQKSVAHLSLLLEKAPKGFPTPSFTIDNKTIPVSADDELRIGNWSWYDKQIVHKPIEYPSQLTSTVAFFNGEHKLLNKPFAFLKNGSGSVTSTVFSPNKMDFKVQASANDTMVLLQNFYPGWKVFVNGKESVPTLYLNTFLALPLPVGNTTVSFGFYMLPPTVAF